MLLFGRIRIRTVLRAPAQARSVMTHRASTPQPGASRREDRLLRDRSDRAGNKGGSTHVLAVAEGLAALGHEVHVAAAHLGRVFPHDGVQVCDLARVGAPLGTPTCACCGAVACARSPTALRPDIIIERYHNFGGEPARCARRRARARGERADRRLSRLAETRLDRPLLVEPFRRWRDWQCRAADLIVMTDARSCRRTAGREGHRNGVGRRHHASVQARSGRCRSRASRRAHRHLRRRLPRLARRRHLVERDGGARAPRIPVPRRARSATARSAPAEARVQRAPGPSSRSPARCRTSAARLPRGRRHRRRPVRHRRARAAVAASTGRP